MRNHSVVRFNRYVHTSTSTKHRLPWLNVLNIPPTALETRASKFDPVLSVGFKTSIYIISEDGILSGSVFSFSSISDSTLTPDNGLANFLPFSFLPISLMGTRTCAFPLTSFNDCNCTAAVPIKWSCLKTSESASRNGDHLNTILLQIPKTRISLQTACILRNTYPITEYE